MSTIQLLDVIEYYQGLDHQKKALSYLQTNIPNPILDKFTDLWRAKPQANGDNQIQAFLNLIRVPEGTSSADGYQIMFTGKRFSSFADHPRIIQCAGELCSDAAGAYQFLSTTWDSLLPFSIRFGQREGRRAKPRLGFIFLFVRLKLKCAIGLPDFSPANQDKGAIELIKRRGAFQNILDGNLRAALDKCSWEWASLPPGRYGQPSISYAECEGLFIKFGGKLR